MNKEHERELKSINRELRKRKFVDTGYLDGLLARRALILVLERPSLF